MAPHRVLTAGHCVMHRSSSKTNGLSAVGVGGVVRDATGFAMHSAWRHTNGTHNVFDDVAIVRLAEPVTDVAPVALGSAPAIAAMMEDSDIRDTLWVLGFSGLTAATVPLLPARLRRACTAVRARRVTQRSCTPRVTPHNAARLIRARRTVGRSWTGMAVVVSVG